MGPGLCHGGRPPISFKPWLILMCPLIKELWSRGSEVGGIRCNAKAEVVRAEGPQRKCRRPSAMPPLSGRALPAPSCPGPGPQGPCKTRMPRGFWRVAVVTPRLQLAVPSDGFVTKAGNEFEQEPARNACGPGGGLPHCLAPTWLPDSRLALPRGSPFPTWERAVVSAHPPGRHCTDEYQGEKRM